jgi:hypothetical protein
MSIEAIKHYEAALLEAFPRGASGDVFHHWNEARKAIKELEKQEPVACAECEQLKGALKRANDQAEHFEREWYLRGDEIEKLQASPPQRQPLTDAQIMQMARDSGLDLEPTRNMLIEVRGQHAQLINMARSIEAAHGIKGKNNG